MSSEATGPLATQSPGQIDQPDSAALSNSPVVNAVGFFWSSIDYASARQLRSVFLLQGFRAGLGGVKVCEVMTIVGLIDRSMAQTLPLEAFENPVQA